MPQSVTKTSFHSALPAQKKDAPVTPSPCCTTFPLSLLLPHLFTQKFPLSQLGLMTVTGRMCTEEVSSQPSLCLWRRPFSRTVLQLCARGGMASGTHSGSLPSPCQRLLYTWKCISNAQAGALLSELFPAMHSAGQESPCSTVPI